MRDEEKEGIHDSPIARLIQDAQSLHGGERAMAALVAYGQKVVPALREILFARDPSGIYQPRCWAVQALAKIGARRVLLEFLNYTNETQNPVERFGDEAVINTAARAVAAWQDEETFACLMRLTERGCLAGVVDALGEFRREETIPIFIHALGEDFCRASAERALKKLGAAARFALLQTVNERLPCASDENASSLRRRRSAFKVLLTEKGVTAVDWPRLAALQHEKDAQIAITACEICLEVADENEKITAIERLIELLPAAGWSLSADIEDCLAKHYAIAKGLVEKALQSFPQPPDAGTEEYLTWRSLMRIKTAAEASSEH